MGRRSMDSVAWMRVNNAMRSYRAAQDAQHAAQREAIEARNNELNATCSTVERMYLLEIARTADARHALCGARVFLFAGDLLAALEGAGFGAKLKKGTEPKKGARKYGGIVVDNVRKKAAPKKVK